MFALAYASRATKKIDEAELIALADHAAENNRELDVTGYLNYSNGVFFQFLEGDEKAVTDLMKQIEADDRHEVVNRILLGEITKRYFQGWSMRYLSSKEMRSIRLEDVLENVLMSMVETTFGLEGIKTTVLRLAGKIAEARGTLADRPA